MDRILRSVELDAGVHFGEVGAIEGPALRRDYGLHMRIRKSLNIDYITCESNWLCAVDGSYELSPVCCPSADKNIVRNKRQY